MKPILLFVDDPNAKEEMNIAAKYMDLVTSRMICKERLVIGRYSCLPRYKELETDLAYNGSKLINTLAQHRWIANFEYYEHLKNYTFETWTQETLWRTSYEGPFVVKGATNSKKYQWNTHMFAKTKKEAISIASELQNDSMIYNQKIMFRKYVPLKTFEVGLNELRFTNEHRIFYYKGKRLVHGYYWSEAEDISSPKIDEVGLAFADEIAKIVAEYCDFYVLDIGEKEAGGWILIEVNDGQMSGTSCIDLDEFYKNLSEVLS
jgi:hypothetical protein